jgi:two-component sensor histidine kinase
MDSTNCYFFKDGSVTSVKIKSLLQHSDPPRLFFSFLKTGKRLINITEELYIQYKDAKNITISYAAISFGGKNVTYQYSFSKSDKDNWIDVNGEAINLVNPGYGTYTMKVRAKTLTSDYCTPIAFTLYILKPYWATWWFITLSVFSVILLIAGIVWYRLLYVFRKKEELHRNEIKFLKSEYKALNALMNPHFIFNTLNNVQSLINKNDRLAANKYLGIFANLVRQNMLNISRELITLQKEIDIVINYLELEKLRFKEKLNYAINIDEKVDLTDIMIPPLLIQPLVENSIKHGILPSKSTDSFISIDIYEQDNATIIAVKDNGIGIDAARKSAGDGHESYGLENMRKRIAQLAIIQNKQISLNINDIKDNSGKLQWTVVSIAISNN